MRTQITIIVTAWLLLVSVAGAAEPLLRSGDRVAILGGTFVERMQYSGSLEAELQCRRPDWKLRIRNLGWSGDNVFAIARKGFDAPADAMKRLRADVEAANPSVIIVAYGFSEASDLEVQSGEFAAGYRQLLAVLAEKPYRLILVKPLAMPGYRSQNYVNTISACRRIVDTIGSELKLPVIDADWSPNDDLLDPSRLLPSGAGYQALARSYADYLVGGEECQGGSSTLQSEIVEKNRLFFHRYRPQNETYLFLFRKHEQGRNAVEIPQFDPLVEAADEAIWSAAR